MNNFTKPERVKLTLNDRKEFLEQRSTPGGSSVSTISVSITIVTRIASSFSAER